ncbi:MAG: hypothetical protein GY803_32460 [Chloroflexi bacterium]|nr:hypothetical protein [Chloroflexota bacterium]
MNKATYLHQMCSDALTQADINAIGKNRGLARAEIASRATLENFYLSPVGVERALATLTQAEIALLHMLHVTDKPVTAAAFERLYNPDFKPSYYGGRTFTQRYQPVFKQARTQLVRKGILIMAQAQMPDATKMERWRFLFPSEFAPYLPRPLAEIQRLDTPGKARRDVPRGKLLALIGQSLTPSPKLAEYELSLQNGRLTLGERPFQAADLQKWQKASWLSVMPGGVWKGSSHSHQSEDVAFSALDTLTYALNLLHPDEWIAPNQLDTILEIFCRRSFDTDAICRLGWEWGYLAKNIAAGQSYYRLADLKEPDSPEYAPADYLSVVDEQTALVNLQTIPYPALEQLNQIAFLAIQEWKLTAVPDFIRMGAVPQDVLESPLLAWLIRRIPAFAQTHKSVQARWGKQIVHTNLQLARVKDLALRVRLERALKPHELVVLSDEYIAFPPKLLSKVKRIVAQAGHVVKHYEG